LSENESRNRICMRLSEQSLELVIVSKLKLYNFEVNIRHNSVQVKLSCYDRWEMLMVLITIRKVLTARYDFFVRNDDIYGGLLILY
jgi:hypothetical protein